MVRRSIILSLLIISIQGCNHENTLTVSGNLVNVTDKSFSITNGSDPRTFLKAEQNALVYEILEDGSFSFTIDASYPHSLTLISENYEFISSIFIIHDGEIHISADCNNTRKTTEISGDNGALNEFYKEWNMFYAEEYRDLNVEDITSDQLLAKLDSVSDVSKAMLLDFREDNKLSKAEIRWLSSTMKYRKYTLVLNRAYRLELEPDALDFNLFNTLDLNDDEACEINNSYNYLVNDYILNKLNASGIFYKSAGDNSLYYEKFYQTGKDELNGKVKDVLLNTFVTDLLSRNEPCAADYYERFLGDCKSKELRKMAGILYDEHISLTESGYNSGVEFVETNDKSPMDILAGFENKVIYLDFWASWCSPCIGEIPHTLDLAKHYQSSEVEVIFVGHRDQRSSLENAIKKYNIVGKHIILNEKESEIWKKEFEVGGIPSYVLLDRNQKVVEFDAPHPENPDVFDLIDSLLLEK